MDSDESTHVLLLVLDDGDPNSWRARELGRGSLAEMNEIAGLLPAVATSDPSVKSASLHVMTIEQLAGLVVA